MSENTNNTHFTKKKEETVLKTPFDFHLGESDNTHPQAQPVDTEFNIYYETGRLYE